MTSEFEYDAYETFLIFKYSEDPRIIYALLNPFGSMPITALLARFAPTPTTLVCSTMISVEALKLYHMQYFDRLLTSIKAFLSSNSGNRFIFLGSSKTEVAVMASQNIDAFFVNQNCFLNYNNFSILNLPKSFDAIYNAQFAPFKRHHLASKIDSLALMFGLWGNENLRYERFQVVHKILPNAIYLNGGLGPLFENNIYRFLNRAQTNLYLNQARCGLCLSEVEGAMYASFEYLLAGLPVVTTPNYGAREVMFPQDFARFSDPNEDAIKNSVDSVSRLNVPGTEIREAAISLAEKHRDRFRDLLTNICASRGADLSEVFKLYNKQTNETDAGTITVPAHSFVATLS